MWVTAHLLRAAMELPNVVDADVKDALAALVKTYRTMQSGLIYETRPDNMLAAALCERVQGSVAELRKRLAEQSGMETVRDTELLGVIAFLQRMEIQQNNGRRYGRAFIDFLREQFPQAEAPAAESGPSLIV